MTADLLCDDAVADPYRYFGALRDDDPVHWNEQRRSWVITRYQDVVDGLLDKRLSSERVQVVYDQMLTPEQQAARAPTFAVLADWMVFKDPPDHTRLRNLVKLAFTPRAVRALEPRIGEIVDHVLAGIPERGTIDLVSDVAFPIPAMVIAEMLGVPASDRDLFRRWSSDVSVLVQEGSRERGARERAQAGLVGLRGYLQQLVRRSAQDPGDNLLSALMHARDAEDALSEDEIVHSCVLLLFAGHETTTNLLASGFLALVDHPNQLELLLADPPPGELAVEELNRFDGPAKMVVRRAAEDLDLHGQRIRAGDRVLLVVCSANRDPRRFGEPDALNLRRDDNRHVAFGLGIHYCLGAPLARLEVLTALPRIVRCLADPRIDRADLSWLPLLLTRGLAALPVTYGGAQ